jgi:peroxiredoxin
MIRYKSVAPGAKFPADYFSWKPPHGARNVAEQGPPAESAEKKLAGKPAPDFTLKTLDGKEVSLAKLKGRTVVLDFWATWCPPCVESLPHLDKLRANYKESQLAAYAVNAGEPVEAVQTFVESHQLKTPVLLDPDGDAAQKYHVASIPQTVIIGPDGVVRRVFVGIAPDTYDEIRDTVAGLARGK